MGFYRIDSLVLIILEGTLVMALKLPSDMIPGYLRVNSNMVDTNTIQTMWGQDWKVSRILINQQWIPNASSAHQFWSSIESI